VHALVSAEVRELCVGLVADVAAERLDATVDVLVLLEAAQRRERFPAAGTLMLSTGCLDLRRAHLQLYSVLPITVEMLPLLADNVVLLCTQLKCVR